MRWAVFLPYLVFWFFGFLILWKIPIPRLWGFEDTEADLSVIIPARNEERNLGRLLASFKPANLETARNHRCRRPLRRLHGGNRQKCGVYCSPLCGFAAGVDREILGMLAGSKIRAGESAFISRCRHFPASGGAAKDRGHFPDSPGPSFDPAFSLHGKSLRAAGRDFQHHRSRGGKCLWLEAFGEKDPRRLWPLQYLPPRGLFFYRRTPGD